MIRVPFAYAFGLGLAATINPCGFALLPAYLSYYLGLTDDSTGSPAGTSTEHRRTDGSAAAVFRACRVSAAMTLGFVVVFGVMGLVWSSVSDVLGPRLPWVTAVLGVGLVVLGIAMLAGFEPVARVPKLKIGKGDVTMWSSFLFGVSYAVASLSCTIGLFIVVVTTAYQEANFVSGAITFLMYALGMGLVVTVLTLAVGLARQGIVMALRRALPFMGRISGALIIVAGAVVAYYGWFEAGQLNGSTTGTGGLGDWLQRLQADAATWIDSVGAVRIGVVCGAAVAGAIAVGFILRRRPPTDAAGTTAK